MFEASTRNCAGRPASLEPAAGAQVQGGDRGRLEGVGGVGPARARVADLGVHRPAGRDLPLDAGVGHGTARCRPPASPRRRASTSGPGDLRGRTPPRPAPRWSSRRADRPANPRRRDGARCPRRPNDPSPRKPVVGLATSNRAPMKVSLGVSVAPHAELELLGLDRRQHLVAVGRRGGRHAALLQARHPAAEHRRALGQADDGRGVVERRLADPFASGRPTLLSTVLVVARAVGGRSAAAAGRPRPGRSPPSR